MSVNAFIPKVWSARLLENLHKQLVFGRLCNRQWEGEIRSWGDTVHISALTDLTVKPYTPTTALDDPEALTGVDRTLVIDHGAYCNFLISDVDAAQARADLMDAAMRMAARRLAEDTEDYILSVIRTACAARQEEELSLTAGNVWESIVAIRERLNDLHVPRTGRALVMPGSVESLLLTDTRFATAATAMGANVLTDGAVARACGFDIYVSSDLSSELVTLTPEAVTFAQQIIKMEAYRREKGFDDCVKALSVCGAKVVQPDCVAVIPVSVS